MYGIAIKNDQLYNFIVYLHSQMSKGDIAYKAEVGSSICDMLFPRSTYSTNEERNMNSRILAYLNIPCGAEADMA